MPVERRSRRLFVAILAAPVIVAVYVAAFSGRFWSAIRPAVATLLGATVIGSIYVEEAWRRTPAPRVSPARAAAVLALAFVVAAAGMPGAATQAASPSETVIKIAQGYIGTPYRLGGTGPRVVDCSGLMFRIFADAGELPRIGGKRMRAIGYFRWFNARGMTSTKLSDLERGDLVYYKNPSHISIYLGDGRALSALLSGVKIHGVTAISAKFVAVLKVNWTEGDPDPTAEGQDRKKKKPRNRDQNTDQTQGEEQNEQQEEPQANVEGNSNSADDVLRGFAIGTMNLRKDADPNARIIGWVSRGSTFKVLDTGNSPSGALWYKVKTRSGKTGWVWSRWARLLDN